MNHRFFNQVLLDLFINVKLGNVCVCTTYLQQYIADLILTLLVIQKTLNMKLFNFARTNVCPYIQTCMREEVIDIRK